MARSRDRPPMPERPEYGTGSGSPVPWTRAERGLVESRYYWLSTIRPDGRPHVVPIWAVWDGALYFATAPTTVTARSLEHRPFAVAHPDDAREVVIVEGAAERLGAEVPTSVVEDYDRKYGWRLDPADEGMPFYVLRATVVLAWSSADIRGTAARWALSDLRGAG